MAWEKSRFAKYEKPADNSDVQVNMFDDPDKLETEIRNHLAVADFHWVVKHANDLLVRLPIARVKALRPLVVEALNRNCPLRYTITQ